MNKFFINLTLDQQDELLSVLEMKGGMRVIARFLKEQSDRTDMELREVARTMEDVQYIRGQRIGLAIMEKFFFHDAPRFFESRNQKRTSGV